MPKESGDYVKAFLKMFGDARPYVTMQSCKKPVLFRSYHPAAG